MSTAATDIATLTYYQRLGGEQGIRQLVNDFYDQMERDPEMLPLRHLHANDLSPMRQNLFEFLSAWLGGPDTYWQRGGKCMASAHAPFHITGELAQQWLTCMQRALDQLPVEPAARDDLSKGFAQMCSALVRQ